MITLPRSNVVEMVMLNSLEWIWLIDIVVAEGSTALVPKSVIGHGPEPIPASKLSALNQL
jgi:hypothetical protein